MRTIAITVAALLASACATTSPAPVTPAAPATGTAAAAAHATLRVISTNDFHGHLLPETQSFANGARVGGAAELAAYIARDRAAFDGPTLVIDGGDVMQGTPLSNLVEGRSSVDFFNAVGYAAAAIGNHELDWGQQVLRDRIAQAHYPWLAANLTVAGSDTTPSWVKPTAIVRAGNLRIGIVGLITQEVPQTTQLKNITGLSFSDGAAAIDRWVPEMRRQNVDFVIVVTHAGGICERDGTNCRGELFDWLKRVHSRPDMVVSGHTHTVIQTFVNGIPVVQSGSYGNRYNVTDLTRIRPDSVAARISPLHVVYADSIKPDSAVASLVARVRAELGPAIERVIANASEAIPRGSGENPMGRLIADGWRYNTGAQIAFMNTGGVRGSIDAGPITWGELYTVHPFANRLITLHMTGAHLRGAIEHGVAGARVEAQVSGLRGTYDLSKPAGSRVVSLTLEDGTPIRDDSIYTVVVNDFLATGQGDGFADLGQYVSKEDEGMLDLESLIKYVEHLGNVTAPTNPRLSPVGSK
jgi:2',3'-cyclic-nucleotide 2'-phosphodiesterase (5'-nucleotidase family)